MKRDEGVDVPRPVHREAKATTETRQRIFAFSHFRIFGRAVRKGKGVKGREGTDGAVGER